ncbi:MAG TPA: cupin domain-containing protein [Gammaproteobacteria bacterium]|nr:cupin domain-containing protein [Gammaproteobacteria bacterium]
MPAYLKGNVPPVIPSKPKTFIERRVGPHDRRVADRRVANMIDRRISVDTAGEYPAATGAEPDGKDHVLAGPRRGKDEAAAAQETNVAKTTPADKVIKQVRQATLVVDAVDVDKSHRVYTVKPEVFMDIVDRLNLSMVIHYQKRRGMNVYFIQFEGGVVETETPNRLSMLDASEQDMEKPTVSDIPASASRTEPTAVKPAPASTAVEKGPQNHPVPKEKLMASKKKRTLMEYHTEEGYYVTEWWNSPDDPALSVARIRIEPGATPSSYELHGVTERFLFLTGHGMVEIDDKQYEVRAGDGLLIKAGARRRVTNLGDRDLGFLAICRPRFSRLSDEPMQNKFVRLT